MAIRIVVGILNRAGNDPDDNVDPSSVKVSR